MPEKTKKDDDASGPDVPSASLGRVHKMSSANAPTIHQRSVPLLLVLVNLHALMRCPGSDELVAFMGVR